MTYGQKITLWHKLIGHTPITDRTHRPYGRRHVNSVLTHAYARQ